MILVDTSIWIDHLHRSDATLAALLHGSQVRTHPMIIGELALGSLRDRQAILALLAELPNTPQATHAEVMLFVEAHALFGIGLSFIDAHLLAAVRLGSSDLLWTRDRRLHAAAKRLGMSADLSAAVAVGGFGEAWLELAASSRGAELPLPPRSQSRDIDLS